MRTITMIIATDRPITIKRRTAQSEKRLGERNNDSKKWDSRTNERQCSMTAQKEKVNSRSSSKQIKKNTQPNSKRMGEKPTTTKTSIEGNIRRQTRQSVIRYFYWLTLINIITNNNNMYQLYSSSMLFFIARIHNAGMCAHLIFFLCISLSLLPLHAACCSISGRIEFAF